MAEIRPFRGIVFNVEKLSGSDVLAPPYDVIDDAGRAKLAAKSEHNCVRLILPEGEGDAKYESAAKDLDAWLADGSLMVDEHPAVYRYHQTFEHPDHPGRMVTRKGFISGVRLHHFDERVILPHERTLKGPKIDRLKLMSATHAHTSQIFALYSDPALETDRLFEDVEQSAPYLDAVTDDGTRHRIWKVADRELIGDLARLLAPARLYIADGHHRYETMLAYRDALRKDSGGELASDSSAEFGTLFLANMDDPGLVVLPTHRLIHSVTDFSVDKLFKAAEEHFEVTEVKIGTGEDVESVLGSLTNPGFIVVIPGEGCAAKFELANPRGSITEDLDVVVLHDLVLDGILGIDKAAQEAKTNIDYVKGTRPALARLGDSGDRAQVGFLMRPCSVGDVKAVSDAGEYMPQKSTFFVPKIASGVVFRRIDPSEILD